ncbi:MAG: hypothetical protein AAB358_03555, partial [Patescibacteria group bacterium]
LLIFFCTIISVKAQTTYIEPPQNVKVGYQDNGTVAITWDPSTTPNIDGYMIYRDDSLYANIWNYTKNNWVQGATSKFALDLDAVNLNNGTSTRHKYQVLARIKESSRLNLTAPNVAGSIIEVIDIPHNQISLGDLIITDIETIPSNPVAYQNIGYKITIKNQGPGDVYVAEGATTPVEMLFSWGIGNAQSGYYYISSKNIFSAGKTQTFEVTSTNFYYEKSGEYQISACIGCDTNFQTGQINPNNVSNKFFKETNYSNNTFSKNITVTPSQNNSVVDPPKVMKVKEDGFFNLNGVVIYFIPPQNRDFKGVKLYRSEASSTLGQLIQQKDIGQDMLAGGVLGDFLSANINDTGKNEEGLPKGKTYYYTLRAYNRAGQESSNTDQYSITINEEWKNRIKDDKIPPSLPQNIELMSGFLNGQYPAHYIRWDNIKDEDIESLKVYRSDVAGNLGEWIGNAAPFDNDESYGGVYFYAYDTWENNTVPKVYLESGKTYYYTFEPVDMSGNSQQSQQYALKTVDYQLPQPNQSTTTIPVIYDLAGDINKDGIPDQLATMLSSNLYFSGSANEDLNAKYQEYTSVFGLGSIIEQTKNNIPPTTPENKSANKFNFLWYVVGILIGILVFVSFLIYSIKKNKAINNLPPDPAGPSNSPGAN